jgi:group I intron endonuclease
MINGKKYIGLDKKNNPSYLGSGLMLKKAIRKYGRQNFVKEILQECSSIQELKNAEKMWIKKFNADLSDEFYNLSRGGEMNGPTHHSDETKRKISERNIGKTMSYESRKKISFANRYKVRSDDTREKLRIINTGKKLSEIHKHKISNSLIGRVHSEETRKKIQESNIGKNLGKYPSEETRAKLSKAATGRNHTEESKEKIRIKSIGNRSRTGMPHRAETKEKIRNAHMGIKKNPESVYKNFLAQKKKPIEQYDVDGKFLQEYDGIRLASRINGIKRQSLVSALNGRSKTSGGFIWKYKRNVESESQNG